MPGPKLTRLALIGSLLLGACARVPRIKHPAPRTMAPAQLNALLALMAPLPPCVSESENGATISQMASVAETQLHAIALEADNAPALSACLRQTRNQLRRLARTLRDDAKGCRQVREVYRYCNLTHRPMILRVRRVASDADPFPESLTLTSPFAP
ncbi:MAG: hypothetical protein H6707_04360 [Deltaproteobacteria bacterium]|nr:hypothetical protein [Deltaproteobacteria bacterium]